MRRYSVLMALGLLSMLLLGLQLSASPLATPTIAAEVNIHPEVFNLNQRGVITVNIRNLHASGSYDIKDINMSTIMLYHENTFVADPLRVAAEGKVLIAKFDAAVVADYIWSVVYHMGIVPPIRPRADYTMEFTVRGELSTGEPFAGSDTIKIISPGPAT